MRLNLNVYLTREIDTTDDTNGGEDDGMRVVTKLKMDELEIIKIYTGKSLTITVEIFTVPDGYKSLATNSYHCHDSLTGIGLHKDKKESAKLAIKDLRDLMTEFTEE
ncbi:hypothetical protein M3610_19950 [Neobacillus sp. MER 74]|uniref:hypothetical protein n=1 Tax=Neobacillus sp. MER 74 TaxID=2939566 RepID=UPI00204229CB|nr:hypothetical protein [Neobacillus sp. MER 74]MCM3117547.1 hypothetical protein [Neobacillus sp. MER 74]